MGNMFKERQPPPPPVSKTQFTKEEKLALQQRMNLMAHFDDPVAAMNGKTALDARQEQIKQEEK